MENLYNYCKAFHLIFVITWFAGLFYIVRLFVYYAEALQKPQPDKTILTNQYKIMVQRLWYIITWPSAILCSIFGFYILFFTALGKSWLAMPWMHVKLLFVFFLYIYHLKCHQIVLKIKFDKPTHNSNFFRIWNEVATIILFAVVFLVILKNAIHWIYGVLGLILLSVILMLGYKFYKKTREKSVE